MKLIQPSTGYRAGIDPLFLSAALHPKKHERILDVGCGVGTAAIALAVRCPHVKVTGMEIQLNLCEFALRNLELNSVMDRVDVIPADVLSPPSCLQGNMFDHVMTNPPYYEDHRSQSSPIPEKAQANTETVNLDKWIRFCLRVLKPKGIFTMIHRAERLAEIMTHLETLTGDIVVYPLWPSLHKPARRIIVQARKDTGGELRLARGIILHGGVNKYTPEAEAILRHAQSLTL